MTELKPAAYNPRKKLKPGDKEYEKIKNSIQEFGFADPLVVNADMTIIGGHQRLTVAMDLGYTEVPCAVVDIDKTREKALNIALNKITGAWDDNMLADLLKDLEASDFNTALTGFEPPEMEQLFNKVCDKEVKGYGEGSRGQDRRARRHCLEDLESLREIKGQRERDPRLRRHHLGPGCGSPHRLHEGERHQGLHLLLQGNGCNRNLMAF